MKPRHLLLAAGLCLAGWLALLGDRTPVDAVEPVVRSGSPAATLVPTSTLVSVPATAQAKPPALSPATEPAAAPSPASTTAFSSVRKPRPPAIEAEVLAIQPRPAPGDAFIGSSAPPLFASQSWAPPPPKLVPPPPPPPPPPPSAPPLPFTYLGKQVSDGQWTVFLARGDATFIATAGSVIDERYRVDSVTPPIMTLTYLPLKKVQQLSIGVHN